MEAIKTIEYLAPEPGGEQPEVFQEGPAFLVGLIRFGFSTLGRLFPNRAAAIAYTLFSSPRKRAKHRISDATIEKARLFEVLYGKHILKGYEWGQGDKVILLVHGWESRGTALRSFVPTLLEQGYKVVAFDGPAHGNSGGKSTNLRHFGGAVRAVINHIGSVDAVITHSFGGVSTVFALWQIDPSIQINRLVLIGVPNRAKNMLETVERMLWLPKVVSRKFKAILESKIGIALEEGEIKDANGQIQVADALIVHDKNDPIVKLSEAEAVYGSWDNASMLVTEGYGHYKLVKSPRVVERVVQFIIED